MQFDEATLGFLKGEALSSGHTFFIGQPEQAIVDRLTLLSARVRGQTVVHVGCADHVELIRGKMERRVWLHQLLCESAKRCVGVDINPRAISYLRDELGLKDVYCADVTRDEMSFLHGQRWDILVLGEVLEHIGDPMSFLRAIARSFAGRAERILLTVPNALSWGNIRAAMRHQECVNTDHKFWFTPYTLGALLTGAGMNVGEFQFCEAYPPSSKFLGAVLRKVILRRFPALRETLVMEAGIKR
jgi:hypothetical protein